MSIFGGYFFEWNSPVPVTWLVLILTFLRQRSMICTTRDFSRKSYS